MFFLLSIFDEIKKRFRKILLSNSTSYGWIIIFVIGIIPLIILFTSKKKKSKKSKSKSK
jgi:hypothetical protein